MDNLEGLREKLEGKKEAVRLAEASLNEVDGSRGRMEKLNVTYDTLNRQLSEISSARYKERINTEQSLRLAKKLLKK